MRVLAPRVLTYRSHWLPGTMLSLLFVAVGGGLVSAAQSSGQTAIGVALLLLSAAAFADRRTLVVDPVAREVRLGQGLLGLLLPGHAWPFESFSVVSVRAGGGSVVSGPQRLFFIDIDGSRSVRVPLRCTTPGDARVIAGEIAEVMRLPLNPDPGGHLLKTPVQRG